MIHIGCSGFPVPATRYLREFLMTEVADTHLGVPGPALVRRWRREAPPSFVFTALCPKDLTAEGLRPNATAEAAWSTFVPVARDLAASAVVFTSPPDLAPGKSARATVRSFFERFSDPSLPLRVWEAPVSWELKDAEAAVKEMGVLVARDPYRHPAFGRVPRGYYRLPGPAGHKSRYEDPALEAVAETVKASQSAETFVVFANVDMYADARRLRRLIEGP